MCVVQAIPGAADVIKHLKAAGVPYKFVTNTTTDKRAGALQRHHVAASQHAQAFAITSSAAAMLSY
jgi:ribonucleotide monophosphatase NagD (HAD superfamily)